MARGKRYKSSSRDAGGFVAIPWSVLDSASYQELSHPARSLLMEFARQYHGDDNGRMVATHAYLKSRGWSSKDVITRAKNELLDAGLIFETCKGQRPHKASWYALTWLSLDKLEGYDAGVEKAFPRGAYGAKKRLERAAPAPSGGVTGKPIGPSGGAGMHAIAP